MLVVVCALGVSFCFAWSAGVVCLCLSSACLLFVPLPAVAFLALNITFLVFLPAGFEAERKAITDREGTQFRRTGFVPAGVSQDLSYGRFC